MAGLQDEQVPGSAIQLVDAVVEMQDPQLVKSFVNTVYHTNPLKASIFDGFDTADPMYPVVTEDSAYFQVL